MTNSPQRQARINKEKLYSKRGLGYAPINTHYPGASLHHLCVENNLSFCIFLPDFLHMFYTHNHNTGRGMDTINAIALSVLIEGDDQFL